MEETLFHRTLRSWGKKKESAAHWGGAEKEVKETHDPGGDAKKK